MHRGILLASGLLLFVASTARAQQAEADRLVKEYFAATDDSTRRAAVKAIEDNKDITIQMAEDAVRRGVFYTAKPTGIVQRKIKVELDGQETDCTLFIPSDYDPAKAYPALVMLHGTGGTGEKFIQRWLPYLQKRGMIGIAPTGVEGVDKRFNSKFGRGHGYGWQELERSVPISALNAARRDYHVDSDRVYVTGCSMGGHGAWDVASAYSDRFAGAIPEAGVPMVDGYKLLPSLVLPNLFNVRVYCMQGTPDKDQPVTNRQAVLDLTRMGYSAEYREFTGAGHGTYPQGSDAALDYVMQGKRDIYSKDVTKLIHLIVHGRAYWLTATKLRGSEWDPSRQIRVSGGESIPRDELLKKVEEKVKEEFGNVRGACDRDRNTIDLRVKEVRAVVVHLHDRMVDMDKPVVFKVNGRQVRRRAFNRDVGFMLDEVRKDYDTGRIFYNSTTLNVN